MTSLTYQTLTAMLNYTAEAVLGHVDELNRLDTKIGDGDHGTTMLKVMSSLKQSIQSDASNDIAQLLNDIGWNIMSQDGGSAGMLMGCLFTGMADGYNGQQPVAIALNGMLRSGTDNLCRNSGAKPGDKTMLDALLPAVATFEESALAGVDTSEAFRLAAGAAQTGAEDTANMIPTRGRAKNLGAKALGTCDPGATSMALVFAAFARFWAGRE